ASRGTAGHRDLARLGLLAHGDGDAEHAIRVRRRDAFGVDALAEAQLAQERAGLTLPGDPLHAVTVRQRALGADGQQLTVDVDVDRPRVDAWKVSVQHIRVPVAVQVH